MCEDRNLFGFPYESSAEMAELAALLLAIGPTIGCPDYLRIPTKLERAKAIAAEVCARRFPVARITPKGDV